MTKFLIGALGAALVLTACAAPTPSGQRPPVKVAAGQPDADELTIDTLGGGAFRGRAGSAWTRDEIPAQLASLECGGKRPARVDIQPIQGGGFTYSGRC